jgi:thiamine-monophosphate kinase
MRNVSLCPSLEFYTRDQIARNRMNNHHRTFGEFDLIDWIRQREGSQGGPWTKLGIGDDCAILDVNRAGDLLVTTDMLMDGRHFRLAHDGPRAAGYKALGVNLSDIAAMAGVPRACVVAVALPRTEAAAVAQEIYAGMHELATRFGVDLVGGDTNAWDGPLVISVTLLGETTPRGAIRRAGAQPGDIILVSGPLGGSLFAGRHLRPEPRIALALATHEAVPIHALIDISDGLSSDLGHILEDSGGLGAILDVAAIPIHSDAHEMSQCDGTPALDHALNDGEDFELCLVVSADDAARLVASPPAPAELYRIGTVTELPGLLLRSPDDRQRLIEPMGFDHFRPVKDPPWT